MPEVNLLALINPSEKQYKFLQALRLFLFPLYGGAAYGGKSYILRWGAAWLLTVFYTIYGVRGARVALMCENYPELIDRQLVPMRKEFPGWMGRFSTSRVEGFNFKLCDELGGGMILPRNLDEPSKYNSSEFAAIFIDELTLNKNVPDLMDELPKRIRHPRLESLGVNLPLAAATNPPGPGHAFVKRLWIDKDLPRSLRPLAEHFQFIPAKVTDNPFVDAEKYRRERLLTITDPRRRAAFADGSWDLFEGQFFGEWRPEYHICKPFFLPPYWRRFCSMDWGYANYACNLWFAVSPDGRVFVYKEIYVREQTNEQLGKACVELSRGERIEYRLLNRPGGDTATAKAAGGKSIQEQLADAGWPCTDADDRRVIGWAQCRLFLSWQENKAGKLVTPPQVQIFENCTNLIRTLPGCVFDKHNPEDVDSDGEDHAPDAFRYGLMSRPKPSMIPVDSMDEEYLRALVRAKHEEEKQRERIDTGAQGGDF